MTLLNYLSFIQEYIFLSLLCLISHLYSECLPVHYILNIHSSSSLIGTPVHLDVQTNTWQRHKAQNHTDKGARGAVNVLEVRLMWAGVPIKVVGESLGNVHAYFWFY